MPLLGPRDARDNSSKAPEHDNLFKPLVEAEAPISKPQTENSEGIAPGKDFGRYLLLDKLGAGGMGVVYAAYDSILGRRIAIKFLRYEGQASSGGSHSTAAQRRLFREAQSLAKLNHPNVVAVYDVGQRENEIYLAMELIDGCSLSSWLKEGKKSWREVVSVMQQVAHGLAAAHEINLVHRDVKPDNVLIDREQQVYLVDFGLARETASPPMCSPREVSMTDSRSNHDKENLTRHGSTIGTPAYMAPEQHECKIADGRSDQYSFCVTLYEALYGKRLFAGGDEKTLREAKKEKRWQRSSAFSRNVPLWLRNILNRGLSLDPEQRFPTMYALIDAIDRGVERDKQRRFFSVLSIVTLAAAVSVSSIYHREPDLCDIGDDSLAGIWDTKRATEVQRGFLGSGDFNAQKVWGETEGKLWAYTSSWLDAREKVCLAHRDGDQSAINKLDTKIACSDRQIARFKALTEQFEHADSNTVLQASKAVFDLPNPENCIDISDSQDFRPQPQEEELRKKVEEQRTLLEKSVVLYGTGHFKEARELNLEVVRVAEGLGFGPLLGEAYLRLAVIYRDQLRTKLAMAALRNCIDVAVRCGDDSIAAEAAAYLIFVRSYQAGDASAYDGLVLQAESMIKRAGESDKLMSFFYNARSAAEQGQWRTEKALNFARQGAELAERAFGPEHPYTSMALHDLAISLVSKGDFSEGKRLMEQMIEAMSRNLGDEHPDTLRSRHNFAGMLIAQGRVKEALERYQQNMAVDEKVLGDEGLQIILGYSGRALAYLWTAQPFRALEDFRRSLEAMEGEGEGDGLPLFYSRLDVVNLLTQLGRLEESWDLMQKAISDVKKHQHMLDDLARFYVDINIAQMYLNRGEVQEAERQFSLAMKILDNIPNPPDALQIDLLSIKSVLAMAHREFDEALHYHQEKMPMIRKVLSQDNFRFVADLYGLCRLQRLNRQWNEAETTANQAIDLVEAELGVRSGALTTLLIELGEIYIATGRLNRAKVTLERARRVYNAQENWPIHRADLNFLEAKLLVADPNSRPVAMGLAEKALAQYIEAGPTVAISRELVEQWIAMHDSPGRSRSRLIHFEPSL